MKSVLVTGAGGFIGRFVSKILSRNGWTVHAADLRRPDKKTRNVFYHECDLLKPENRKGLIKEIKPFHLIHLAWYAEHGKFWRSPENFKWVEASLSLFREFAEAGGKRIVSAGTCAEYDLRYGYCSESVTPLMPKTPYGACKMSLHEMLRHLSHEMGISYAWGRVFFLYGPYEAEGRLVSSVIISLLRNQPAKCTHGEQIRDFLHVEDVASAFVSILESNVEGPVNIASGEPVRLKAIVNLIGDITGKSRLIRLGAIKAPDDEPPFIVADIRRLTGETGWSRKIGLDAGLRDTIGWWRKSGN